MYENNINVAILTVPDCGSRSFRDNFYIYTRVFFKFRQQYIKQTRGLG